MLVLLLLSFFKSVEDWIVLFVVALNILQICGSQWIFLIKVKCSTSLLFLRKQFQCITLFLHHMIGMFFPIVAFVLLSWGQVCHFRQLYSCIFNSKINTIKWVFYGNLKVFMFNNMWINLQWFKDIVSHFTLVSCSE